LDIKLGLKVILLYNKNIRNIFWSFKYRGLYMRKVLKEEIKAAANTLAKAFEYDPRVIWGRFLRD
jgi:hypothetical protein